MPASPSAVVQHQDPSLGSWNQLKLVYDNATYTYTYWVLLSQHRDGLLTGCVYDSYLAAEGQYGWLAVHGDVADNVVQFEVTHPAGDRQGSRAFIGTISGTGALPGIWDETGSEAGAGTFSLVNPV